MKINAASFKAKWQHIDQHMHEVFCEHALNKEILEEIEQIWKSECLLHQSEAESTWSKRKEWLDNYSDKYGSDYFKVIDEEPEHNEKPKTTRDVPDFKPNPSDKMKRVQKKKQPSNRRVNTERPKPKARTYRKNDAWQEVEPRRKRPQKTNYSTGNSSQAFRDTEKTHDNRVNFLGQGRQKTRSRYKNQRM
ncbi:hypothetical protein SNE40_008605 [Patella caerulea]|uniref:Uncharacterized protein n=1 Tax=Patella caerulea TaxID=87958 RepID=A0AAN8K1H5_PATCE